MARISRRRMRWIDAQGVDLPWAVMLKRHGARLRGP